MQIQVKFGKTDIKFTILLLIYKTMCYPRCSFPLLCHQLINSKLFLFTGIRHFN